jgi:hypothetical protein
MEPLILRELPLFTFKRGNSLHVTLHGLPIHFLSRRTDCLIQSSSYNELANIHDQVLSTLLVPASVSDLYGFQKPLHTN